VTTPSTAGEWTTLVRGVSVFDGSATLVGPVDVLVRGRHIEAVTSERLEPADGEPVVQIDGTGRTLLPGLIDAHWHAMMASLSMALMQAGDLTDLALAAGQTAEETLLRGFTTVRDVGGPVFGLKRAIDAGTVAGPRIYPSGAFISQTAGHGDYRARHEVPRGVLGSLSRAEIVGVATIADGVPEVLRAVREQLMLGASQIKMMAGGGSSSVYDPIDVTQYGLDELRAGVQAAEDWGTYVTVHAYTDRAVQRALEAGVRCIEHGQLVTEPTVEAMVERQAWWCLQAFLADDEGRLSADPVRRAKQLRVAAGTDQAYRLAKEFGVQLAWGSDVLFDRALAAKQGAQLRKLLRWFAPHEVLRIATADNADLLALSGARNPYPGRLGVVAEGAWADLLLVDGDPLADHLAFLDDPAAHLVAVMKDGRLVHRRTP
jgi:imidazolonepropionase-like amidohydrolase